MPRRLRLAAMVPRLALMVFAVIVIAILAAPTAKAGTVTYDDCRHCMDTGGWLSINMTCEYPASGSLAYTGCREMATIQGSHACWNGNTVCEYDCFGPGCDSGGGGSGGGGGGGGGGDCLGGGYCPLDCFDCGVSYY